MNVPINAAWRKSSRSGQNGQCVELAGIRGGVAVRDSKNPTGPVLTFDRAAMAELFGAIRSGA